MSSKEISLDVINLIAKNSQVELAHAYLELEKEKRQIQVKLDDILTKELNDNRDMQIRILESEITKLKKSREVLRKAVEFYGDRETWELSGSLTNKRYFKNLKSYGEALNDISEFQVPNTFGYAHENKELTYYIAGKKAREAIKADDEIVKEV